MKILNKNLLSISKMLKELPPQPGVYLMYDSLGNIIYVGKAKNLKNRVTQYFRSSKNREPKVEEMVRNIQTFTYFLTDTELDALLDECRLIKELKPRYNRLMKNDLRYIFLKIPAEAYPKITIAKEKSADGAVYFGPFTSVQRVEAAIQGLNEIFPLRKCVGSNLVSKADGCLYRHLGTCLGACTGQVSPAEYQVYMEKVQQLLSGKDLSPVKELWQKIEKTTEKLEFEKAAQYRDYYLGLKHVISKQNLVESSNRKQNILAVEFLANGFPKLFLIKGNRLLHREVLQVAGERTLWQDYLQRLIKTHYELKESADSGLTQLTPEDIDEAQIIYTYLKRNRQRIISFSLPSACLRGGSTRLANLTSKIMDRLLNKKVQPDL
ncbi:MAG: GIY-YIG nuclease family protein [Desulfitobacteriia bacterium]|jgi:excinuclease ABC subunit C